MIPWPDLRPILEGIDWGIVGDVATRAYMPERMTKDMDILARERDGEEVVQRLKDAAHRIKSKLAVPGYLMVAWMASNWMSFLALTNGSMKR